MLPRQNSEDPQRIFSANTDGLGISVAVDYHLPPEASSH